MKTFLKYDLEGNLLESIQVNTVVELAERLDCNKTSLHDHLKGRILSCKNFQIKEFRTDRVMKIIGSVYHIKTGVANKSIGKRYNGELISVYADAQEAAYKNNIDVQLIRSAINYKGTTGGFTFEFIN